MSVLNKSLVAAGAEIGVQTEAGIRAGVGLRDRAEKVLLK